MAYGGSQTQCGNLKKRGPEDETERLKKTTFLLHKLSIIYVFHVNYYFFYQFKKKCWYFYVVLRI